MSGPLIDLQARTHPSRVLAKFLAGRPGDAARRAGMALGVSNAVSSDRDAMLALFAPITASSGFAVNERTAMQVSTVYACLTKLAGAISQLPIHQYRLDNNGDRERIPRTPLWWMLNESPSDAWTAASWKEWIVRCWGLRGDQYTEVVRRGATASSLLPHHPDNVQPRIKDRRLVYDVMDAETGRVRGVDQDDMLHFAGFGFDGRRSLTPISYAARQAIGNSLAAADFAGRTLGEGAMPKIALSYPGKLDPDQAQLLRDGFVATYGGAQGARLPLVLTNGGEAKTLSLSPVDLQLMDLRKMERDQIAETFGVPPILIGSNEKASSWGTGIEQIILGFVRFVIKPHLVRWEEELNRKLFRKAGQFVEFELDGLQRGDSKAQAEAFRAALGGPGTGDGWLMLNEVRRLINRPPVPDGDRLFKANAGKPATPPAEPEPEPEPDPEPA